MYLPQSICAQSLLIFLVSHEKMCQILYQISLFCMATIVARKMSYDWGTHAPKYVIMNGIKSLKSLFTLTNSRGIARSPRSGIFRSNLISD
jgi:hypothetical protein